MGGDFLTGKIKAAVLGATGMVGQRFVQLLEKNPWFRLEVVAASERSAGKKYSEAVRGGFPMEFSEETANLEVQPLNPKKLKDKDVEVVFSALPADVAYKVEEEFAREGFIVLSNASSHRMEVDVPILNPEVNWEHHILVDEQRRRRKWDGAIVTNPNCSAAILTLSLKPIMDNFGLKRVVVSTMQAVSGAGYPGRVHFPPERAGNADSFPGCAGFIDRHLCGVSLVRLFHQHTFTARPGAGHRHRGGRRHRRGRSRH